MLSYQFEIPINTDIDIHIDIDIKTASANTTARSDINPTAGVNGGGGGGENHSVSVQVPVPEVLDPQHGARIESKDENNNYDSEIGSMPPSDLKITRDLVSIQKSSYYYLDPSVPVLTDIEMSLKGSELIIIAGPVGAGKSSLLSVILGEMIKCPTDETSMSSQPTLPHSTPYSPTSSSSSSSSSLCSRMAYCAQRPWILAASVLRNVTIAGKIKRQLQYKQCTVKCYVHF